MAATDACPTRCPHCMQPLPAAVRATALDTARALARLGGQGTAREVAQALEASDRRARIWLRQAEASGLVSRTTLRDARQRERTVGRRAALWRVNHAMLWAYE